MAAWLSAYNWTPTTGIRLKGIPNNLGRKEEVDQETIKRLINSLCRFISPEQAAEAQARKSHPELSKFVNSCSAGSGLVLKGIWKCLHIDKALGNRTFAAPVAKASFAYGGQQRAINPSSKLAIQDWANQEVDLDLA